MFTLLVIVFAIAVIFGVDFLHRKTRYRRLLDRIPGPPAYPLVGNLFVVLFCSPEVLFKIGRQYIKHYGPILRGWLGPIGTVHMVCPEDIEIVISSTKHISKGPVYDIIKGWLGTGLLISDGTKWHTRRKLLTPAFHFTILQQFVNIFGEQTAILIEQLKEETTKSYTHADKYITNFTLNSICETAMGTRLTSNDKNQEVYRKSIHEMGEIAFHRTIRPWFYISWIYMLSPNYWKQKELIKSLHNFSYNVINKRKESFNKDHIQTYAHQKRLAMLDLLLKAEADGVDIDIEGIREEVDTFMFEGHDTTATSLNFSLMLIASHSEVQKNIVKELDEVFGDSDRPPTFADLQKLTYLEMVIKESLRLYPSVHIIARISSEEFTTYTGYTIPRNTIIAIHIFDIHRNPEIYPDPESFIPERFSLENSKNRHPYAYLPFSAGPRNCIGQRFAMLEMKTVLSGILRNFKLEPVDKPSTVSLTYDIILRPTKNIRVKFRPRDESGQ